MTSLTQAQNKRLKNTNQLQPKNKPNVTNSLSNQPKKKSIDLKSSSKFSSVHNYNPKLGATNTNLISSTGGQSF